MRRSDQAVRQNATPDNSHDSKVYDPDCKGGWKVSAKRTAGVFFAESEKKRSEEKLQQMKIWRMRRGAEKKPQNESTGQPATEAHLL